MKSCRWRAKRRALASFMILALGISASAGAAAAAEPPADWNVLVLDRILSAVPPGANLAPVGDMLIPVSNLSAWRNRLAGEPVPESAYSGTVATWTGGVVYYTFSNNVSAPHQKAFLDGMQEWAAFANLAFIPRTTQANYVVIIDDPSISGGLSAVGMVGGRQELHIGSTSWNRATVCHEFGHTLGLIHEHQRSDRDSFVTILTSHIIPGQEGNFVKLTSSQNQGAYDFLSVMHYARNSFSTDPANLDTISPLPAYMQYIDVMGQQFDPVLSAPDRSGMAAKYGAGPVVSNVVTNTRDSGAGSLRAALYYAIDHPGTTIRFNIATNDGGFSNSVFTIQPTAQLQSLANATAIDGTTEPTNSNPSGPEIVLNGSLATLPDVFANGVRIVGSNCAVRGLVINGFNDSGVAIEGSNAVDNVVAGCYIGVGASGTTAASNGSYGVSIDGGATANTIGGTTASALNVISGSAYEGISISGAGTAGNVIEGNYIGLNAAGTAAIPNTYQGVFIYGGARSNIVGGTAAGVRNVISGNGAQGVAIYGAGTDGNRVQGNYIGLNPAGTASISNLFAGVQIGNGAWSNTVGGSAPGAGNVISGNGTYGIVLGGAGTDATVIEGNRIGIDAAGAAAIPNAYAGVVIYGGARLTQLGGTTPGSRNVISGNLNQGVVIVDPGTSSNRVQGNFIGLDAGGVSPVPNSWAGVDIFGGAASNAIGGGPGARNVISGNGNEGVRISGAGSDGNLVQGNTLGLSAAGNAPAPNGWAGVLIFSGAKGNAIGGAFAGAANLIAINGTDGVQLSDAGTSNNAVAGNSIFSNGGSGIALYSGANLSQAAPALNSATLGTNTTVAGTLSSRSNTLFRIEFFASPPGAGSAQGRTYLGAIARATGNTGVTNFNAALASTVPTGQLITATATDPAGNTSAFSPAVTLTAVDSVGDGIPDAWRAAFFGGSGTTTNSQSCATCDRDADGAVNFQEFRAGTNPTNALSLLKIGAIQPSGGDAAISLQTVAGKVYRVETTDDLLLPFWTLLSDQIIGTDGALPFVDPGAMALPARFYRVLVLP